MSQFIINSLSVAGRSCWLLPVLLLLLLSTMVAARQDGDTASEWESDHAPENQQQPQTEQLARDRVIYVDIPVVFEPGIDPVLPTSSLGNQTETIPDEARDRSIRDYDNTLLDIEGRGGVWAPGLIEQLSAQGRLQQLQGDHVTAVTTFDRAMHINRINQGLHSTEQVPIVQELIESYTALEDWANADLYNNYLFYVQQRAYGVEDPRMIPVLAQLAHWHLQAFRIGFGEALGLRLSSAQILLNTATKLVRLHFGQEDERFVSYLHVIADSAYQVASNPDLMAELNRSDFLTSQDLLVARLNQRSLGTPVGFEAGEAALLEVISVFEESAKEPWLLAEAYTSLGDWYLMFKFRRAAEEQYQLAWNLLAEQDGGEELLQCLFGQVVAIPTFISQPRLLYRGSNRPENAELRQGFVDLSFDVTRNGEVRQAEYVAVPDGENADMQDRVVRELRSFLFRPRIVDGLTTISEDNHVRIRYWY